MGKRVHIMVEGSTEGEAPVAHKPPPPPSEQEIAKEHARYEKRRATERWISGSMKTPDHEKIHRRADHILAGKHPKNFKGATGENKGKGLW